MESVDIVVIGAGVVGLAIAAEVSSYSDSVFILEKNTSWGQETSSRNSEVIHGGLYYIPGSLKAVSSVEGRRMLYDICKKENIPFKKIGKLVVAAEERDMEYIQWLEKNAWDSGVSTVLMDGDDVKKIEPSVVCEGALLSGETGIVDTHMLMKHFLNKAVSRGAEIVCCAEVVGVEKQGGRYKVNVDNDGEKVEISATIVINSSGNNADKVAGMFGIDIDGEKYRQIYSKGEYFRVSDKVLGKTARLIYPVPQERSLGIHTVLDLRGGMRLGPDSGEVEVFDYTVDDRKKEDFYWSVKKFLPCIKPDWLSPDMAGIRPQLKYADKNNFRDFIIKHEDGKGFPGVIDLVGIESPGLTASPYIAKYVAKMVKEIM